MLGESTIDVSLSTKGHICACVPLILTVYTHRAKQGCMEMKAERSSLLGPFEVLQSQALKLDNRTPLIGLNCVL